MKSQPTLNSPFPLQSNDIEACHFFIDYLDDRRLLRDNIPFHFDGPAHICSYINDELNDYFGKDTNSINEVISDMVHNLNELMPTDENMALFHKNKRACFWFWSELHCTDRRRRLNSDIKKLNPGNHSERVKEVVSKYKALYLSKKQRRLRELKEDWARIVNNESFMRFFYDMDESTCQYVWDYLCAPKYNISNMYNPVSHEERNLSIFNFFDFYISSSAEKELLVNKIKPAINQRNHRERMKVGNINKRFYLKNENVEKLKGILTKRRMTADEYFNDIIERDSNEK